MAQSHEPTACFIFIVAGIVSIVALIAVWAYSEWEWITRIAPIN